MRAYRPKPIACLAACLALAGCATAPDKFYTLSPATPASAAPRPAISAHVLLDVTVPSIVDRSEIVLMSAAGEVTLLEHERWAAPFADEVAQTLGRNIEARRPDVIVGDRRFESAGVTEIKTQVDIVQVVARRGAEVMLEAHWRTANPKAGSDQLGSERFTASVSDASYSAIARAIGKCLADLGDRIAGTLPVAP